MDKQHILDEIIRTAKTNGGLPLGKGRFFTETGIRESDWFGKYWARWGDALLEAGLNPNKLQESYDEKFLIDKLISLIRELGRYPVTGDLRLKAKRDNTFPSHNVFNRIGKKAELARKVMIYCQEKVGYDDVIEICMPIAETIQSSTNNSEENIIYGFVYLIKSGRFYKIGRTFAIGRREYELAIQLPEKVQTIHIIKTDDPIGIESYWHGRFQDRRKNGEWFELTNEDVHIFKRRKFM
jgi:hypothetical protein